MFVRWKSRAKSRRRRATGHHSLTAVLVESRRVDGKPRQQIISYLGTIDSEHTTAHFHCVDFWASVTRHLGALNLPEYQRLRIEKSLAERVAKPTPDSKAVALATLADVEQTLKRRV